MEFIKNDKNLSPDQFMVKLLGNELRIDQNKNCDNCTKCLEGRDPDSIDCIVAPCPISEEADFILSDIAMKRPHRHAAVAKTLEWCIKSGNIYKIDNNFNVFCHKTNCSECWDKYQSLCNNRNSIIFDKAIVISM